MCSADPARTSTSGPASRASPAPASPAPASPGFASPGFASPAPADPGFAGAGFASAAALRWALARRPAVGSMPMTRPACSAYLDSQYPVPQPRSTTVFPGHGASCHSASSTWPARSRARFSVS